MIAIVGGYVGMWVSNNLDFFLASDWSSNYKNSGAPAFDYQFSVAHCSLQWLVWGLEDFQCYISFFYHLRCSIKWNVQYRTNRIHCVYPFLDRILQWRWHSTIFGISSRGTTGGGTTLVFEDLSNGLGWGTRGFQGGVVFFSHEIKDGDVFRKRYQFTITLTMQWILQLPLGSTCVPLTVPNWIKFICFKMAWRCLAFSIKIHKISHCLQTLLKWQNYAVICEVSSQMSTSIQPSLTKTQQEA